MLAAVAGAGCGGDGRASLAEVRERMGAVRDCLADADLEARRSGSRAIEVGDRGGARIEFLRGEAAVEAATLSGRAEGAEPIGSALLYVRTAGERELQLVEDCLIGEL